MRALAEDLEGLDRGSGVEDALQRIAATMACHAAVKANYPLTLEKMAHILDELRRDRLLDVCPHGRPVMLRLTRREIEKNSSGSDVWIALEAPICLQLDSRSSAVSC